MAAWDEKTRRVIELLEDVIAVGHWCEAYLDVRADAGDKAAVKGGSMITRLYSDARVLREVFYEQGRLFEKPKKKGKHGKGED